MTLLVALTGTDGIVLAADSRGTFGDPRGVTAQNDTMKKAHVLAPHASVLISGAGELGNLIVNEMGTTVAQQGTDWITPITELLRNIVRTRYNEWFPTVPAIGAPALVGTGQVATRPDLGLLLGGYEQDGTPRLYSLFSQLDFAPNLHNHGFAVQGVPQYALYLLNRLYEPDRTVQELLRLAVYAITETASQDGKVGGPVSVITVAPDGAGCQALAPEVVAQIQTENEQRSQALRDSFYEKKE